MPRSWGGRTEGGPSRASWPGRRQSSHRSQGDERGVRVRSHTWCGRCGVGVVRCAFRHRAQRGHGCAGVRKHGWSRSTDVRSSREPRGATPRGREHVRPRPSYDSFAPGSARTGTAASRHPCEGHEWERSQSYALAPVPARERTPELPSNPALSQGSWIRPISVCVVQTWLNSGPEFGRVPGVPDLLARSLSGRPVRRTPKRASGCRGSARYVRGERGRGGAEEGRVGVFVVAAVASGAAPDGL